LFLVGVAPILLLAQAPVISTLAGTTQVGGAPVRGGGGDGGPAVAAELALANLQNECDPLRFEQTSHISLDSRGNLYIADSNNHRIRVISSQGVMTTVAGSGERPANNRCEPTGPFGDGDQARTARLYNPSDVVAHPNGNLIIADQLNNRIRQVTPAGVITTIAGNGTHNLYAPGIPATSSPMDWPSALAIDPAGLVYFAELHGNRVARIGGDGRLATVAGNGFPGFSGDGGQATAALMRKPAGIEIDAAGSLYIADTGNHRVRKVTGDGVIRTIAGNGQQGFAGDGGSAVGASLDTPMDVKVDGAGNVYIADAGNHRVRRVDSKGVISTVAGTGEPARGADLVDPATSALNFPSALAVGANGDVYVVDWQNYLVRKISLSGDPVLVPGGIVNGASFEAFPAPVAPGSIVAIFGVNLAASAEIAVGEWNPKLGDASIELNGAAIPLYSVSPGQFTAQLPYDLPVGAMTAVAKFRGKTSNAITLNIAPASVGLFQFPGTTQAAALNQDGVTINSAAAPETRGRVVVMFLTGQGALDLGVTAGKAAPLDALARALAGVSATIGGVSAEVQFFGLTPGSIGLAQANILIPAAAPAGDAVPVVVEAGGRKSNTATIAIR